MDTYLTVARPSEAVYTEKRSRFLAFVHPAGNEDEVKGLVAGYRKQYYDARHVCYAYILGPDGAAYLANDDGEPSGTAGRPILGQMRARSLTFTLVVVVRYFGGIKLGTGPLAVAYKEAAAAALDLAGSEERVVSTGLRLFVPYTEADAAMRRIAQHGADITARDYDGRGTTLTVSVRLDEAQALRAGLAQIHTVEFKDGDGDN